MGEILVSALRTHESDLDSGALMTVDPRRKRITLLPLIKLD
jgi:hypothetical protein